MKYTIVRLDGTIIAESDTVSVSALAATNKANLREADLCGANLRGADLCGANLRGANLRGANLREGDLRKADLCGANLRGADLRDAGLRGANLRGADLSGANLPDGVLIVQVAGIGVSRRMTTYRIDTDEIWCGCWSGTLAEFRARVAETYPTGRHRAEYDAAIRFFSSVGIMMRG